MKKILIAITCVVLILTITNPSASDFKNFLNATKDKRIMESANYGRLHNYILWSVYRVTEGHYENSVTPGRERVGEKVLEWFVQDNVSNYYGIMKNFFYITPVYYTTDSVEVESLIEEAIDSVKAITE